MGWESRKIYKWIKSRLLIKDGTKKRILRTVLSRHVPQELWDVPKRNFNFPFVDFLEKKNYSIVNRLLDKRKLQKHELFDNKIINDTVETFKRGERNLSFRIWSLIIFQQWFEHHFD